MPHTSCEKLKAELKDLIGNPTFQRPFFCKGSPVVCGIFLVGLNPATEMCENFWDFWIGDTFANESWEVAYKRAREERGRRDKSPTRKNFNLIAAGLHGKCLETNLYWTPTASERDLKSLIRSGSVTAKPFFHLLRALRPRIVVAHARQVIAQRDAIEFSVPETHFIAAERHIGRMSEQQVVKLIANINGQLKTLSRQI